MKHVVPVATLTLLATALSAAYAQDAAPPPAAAASAAESADQPTQLERTIVTGTRTAKSIDKIPGAITVIGKAELAQTLAVTEDATAVLARTVPGYSESSQAMSNTGETLRGRIPLRLFDGVPQGSPLREGTRNATFTDMGIVGRIEVINGPSAAEGIGAAGGIINYISKTPTKMGDEFTLVTRLSTEGHDDSTSYKVGGSWARKTEDYDLLIAGSHIDRGMSYDGHGNAIGLNTSGSLMDSKSNNLFAKFGFDFGTDKSQRLQFSISDFKVTGNNRYHLVDGDRTTGVTNTSVLGTIPGSKAEFNDFKQFNASYTNTDLAGGTLQLDAYWARQAMRYPAENTDDKQDPLIAPLGTLWDQSEILAKKKGLRTSWSRSDIFSVKGLEFRGGVDLTQDNAQQRLALTDRLWVPPMIYDSVAPYVQLSWDLGPLTLSGGVRREDGSLKVDDYTTTYYRNRVAVEGGKLEYGSTLPNIGAVWRMTHDWSAYASLSKGFTLPNVGIPLRNINKPGQSVSGILDLQPIIVRNKEVGVNWRGTDASFGASVYQSYSSLGVSLSIDPVTNDFIMNRAPVQISGFELSGDYSPTRDLKLSGLYSRILGKTTFVAGGPLDKRMGVNDTNPDKIGGSMTWTFMPKADVTLGFTKLLDRDLNVGTSAEEHTKGYTLWNMSGNYDWGKYGKTTLGIENLTNKFYILSWSQLAGYRNYWSGRGRVVSLTQAFTF
ncbi:TonB-dependent receptor [Paucibacter sp. R3-3]|uniref:TonB-dependent receptor n=1 Tax=Roseateles agri TaxID=3098619 RepID=A0ABU5DCZ2_9BURK|nr:TonB-dependent receptor [Paucibacter sp. R3-3]MDY0744154.1 TonB-dependent receptor [Paucibacter sp. R3-3]